MLALLPAPSLAAEGDAGDPATYCVTPAFIASNIPPNLLLIIDNSASMYDLFYQDSTNKYCGNSPTTACSADSTCAALGGATCRVSGTSTTATTNSAKPCTVNGNCPVTNKCTNGFCRFNENNLVNSDYVTTTSTTFTPTACSNDATCSAVTSGDTCNNKCDIQRQCFDTTYNPAFSYSGYFEPAQTYYYDSANARFVSGATMPGTCSYSAGATKYVCINVSNIGTATEAVLTDSTGLVAKGSFLNWLSASKFDIQKQILTGGKYDAGTHLLIGESRGCAGRKFIKVDPALADITFAIRGGTPGGVSSTQNLATEYGQTYIEIYQGDYNEDDCLAAMDDWMEVSSDTPPQLGNFQNNTKGCVGTEGTLAASNVTAVSLWNHILHDCYQGITGGAQGYETNLGPLLDECKNIYATIAPGAMTDTNSGYAVCSGALTYLDASGTAQTGYLGACWNSSAQNFSNCTQTQQGKRMENYCLVNVTTNPVIDPSSTTIGSASQSAPGFILEQGLLNTVPIGSFPVKVYQPTGPVGLIHDYQQSIRFGVQTFQNNGAGSECGSASDNKISCSKTCSLTNVRVCYVDRDCPVTGGVQETCQSLAEKDGGQMLTYVGEGFCSLTTGTACTVDANCPSGEYCKPSIGGYSSGLVKAINDIQATSWTPVAEAFYNSIGYFARLSDYSEAPASRSDSSTPRLPRLADPHTAGNNYDTDKNPSQYRCQSNNVLLISDGMSTADQNDSSEALADLYDGAAGIASGYDSTNSCPPYSGSRSLSTLAWLARNRDIKTLVTSGTASTALPVQSSERITTYVVYSGPETSGLPGLCDPKTLMETTAAKGGTTLYSAQTPETLRTKIKEALSTVAAKAASGTAASILSNSEGSGANILQAVFFPMKKFQQDTYAEWIGEMQNLWYFVDPLIDRSTIREDTLVDNKMDLLADHVVSFRFDSSDNTTYAYTSQDTDGDGLGDTTEVKHDSDDIKSVWRAGKLLHERNLIENPRVIYTPLLPGGTQVGSTGLMRFSYGNVVRSDASVVATLPDHSDELRPYLQATTNDQSKQLMKYVHGFDFPDDSLIRNRTVKKGLHPTGDFGSADYEADAEDRGIGVWKLGDIISSTPRIQSTAKLNGYSLPPPSGYSDVSYSSYIGSSDYKNRGTVYVGANDGMLHAFNFGLLNVSASENQKASLDGTDLGKEMWAFIPKHTLPYLTYYSKESYGHTYYVDGATLLFDASIGAPSTVSGCSAATYWDCNKPSSVVSGGALDASKNPWRSILIGGMGLGGASAMTCTDRLVNNCVPTPLADPADATKALGYSSYFALDVTQPETPSLLWEFSDPALGYATTGPAIIRVGAYGKNGRWFAVFGSGPTGPIDQKQFMGRSNQTLKFFIVDLRTGLKVRTIDTGIANAFAGSMIGGAIDSDRWNAYTGGHYQDDAIYVGYTNKTGTTWTNGGVIRIVTKESTDFDTWTWSKVVDATGPVTTAIARLQDRKNKKLWLYFGTGRYYSRSGTEIDDFSSSRAIYGIKEPCYNTAANPGNLLDDTCTATVSTGITDQSTTISGTIGAGGWKINLDASTTDFGAERVVTDAVTLTNGTVFLTSFAPTADICGFGGNSYLWALDYDTGGRPDDAALAGKALIQLSTGEFKEVDLAEAFGAGSARLMRRTNVPMTGKPPADAFPIVSKSGNKPVKRIMHIQER